MKRAILVLRDYLLLDILKSSFITDSISVRIIANGLPDDVKIIRAGHNDIGTLRLLLESEEFEDIEKGKEYPELPCPVFERGIK